MVDGHSGTSRNDGEGRCVQVIRVKLVLSLRVSVAHGITRTLKITHLDTSELCLYTVFGDGEGLAGASGVKDCAEVEDLDILSTSVRDRGRNLNVIDGVDALRRCGRLLPNVI
jgi:hypothetical protein